MLPCPTGLQKRHLANSEALCRSATCRHNRVTSQEFQGTYFLLAQAGRMVDAPRRLQMMGQVAAPNGSAKTLLVGASRVSLKASSQRHAYSSQAASGLPS